MPVDIRVIRAQEFVKATPEGRLDLAASKQLLADVASATGGLSNYQIMLDTRMTESFMNESDLWDLATALSELGSTFHRKTALLCSADRLDRSKFFALMARYRGFEMRAFTSYENAMEWLVEGRSAVKDLLATS